MYSLLISTLIESINNVTEFKLHKIYVHFCLSFSQAESIPLVNIIFMRYFLFIVYQRFVCLIKNLFTSSSDVFYLPLLF